MPTTISCVGTKFPNIVEISAARATVHALLIRDNKPKTTVQSSAPFSLGTTWIVCHAH